MEFLGCLSDGEFGPGVQGCREDFDFTLKFEKIFLSILPSAIFIALSISRSALVARWPRVVRGTWFQICKLATLGVYAALQLPLLALSAKSGRLQDVFVSADALGFIAAFCMCALSFLEHSRTPRPSMLLNTYLFITILCDIAQVRSLWLAAGSHDERTYTSLFTATIAIKAVVIILESVQKRRWLGWEAKDHSPEETAGLYGLGAFLWLNSLFLTGYKKLLRMEDLYPLDQQMLAVKLEAALTARIEVAKWGGKKNALTKTLFRTLAAAYLLPVGPRLALAGFQLCQPFLIESLLSHLAKPEEKNGANFGKGLIGASVLIYGGISVSTAFYWYFQERAMYMARGSLAAAIYKKTTLTRLDAADDSAAVTLMSTDVERIRIGLLFFHEFWVNILQAIVASYLLYRVLGAAFAASIVLVIVSLVFAAVISKIAAPAQKNWMEKIQKRVGLTASVISNMKHLKISGLTVPVEASIQELRMQELTVGGKFRMVQAWTALLGFVPILFAPVFTFAVTSRNLDVTTIYTSISYLVLLATPLSFVLQLIPTFIAGLACLNRIQVFLEKQSRTDFREFPEQPNTEKLLAPKPSEKNKPAIQVVHGSFGWTDDTFNLKDISASIPANGLTIVVGPIASGKSTLCKALLGETPLFNGRVIMGKNFRRIGYCDQNPFMTNSTIRENITGFSVFDEERYREVLDACQLTKDLSLFPQGDRTNIGSNGITLSGGQKQRVSIARALYAEADLLIFDDILSGLDADTEEQVFSRVFGPFGILKQREATVVLCTHSVRHVPAADHIIALSSEGGLVEEGNFTDLIANQKYVHSLGIKPLKEASSGSSTPPSVEKTEASFEITRVKTGHSTDNDHDPLEQSRMTGDLAVYKHYARSFGWSWLTGFLACGVLAGFFYNFPTVWLKFWAEDVGTKVNPTHSNAYYIGLYTLWQCLCMVFFFLTLIICLKFMIQISGASLHRGLLAAVIGAPLSFFTQTDSGVVTNLFSQDMTIIDGELPISLINVIFDLSIALGQAAIIATSSPWLAISYPFLIAVIFGIQKFYLRTSRQLRLLDLEAKSPLYTHFLDTIKGLATFRAFAWTQASIAENNTLVDTSQRPAYLLAMIQRWLLFVLNVLVGLLAVIVVTLATQLRANQGFTGASLVSIMGFGESLANIIRMYTTLETSIGAVSRLKSFTENTKVEDLPNETVVPPQTWPSQGTIEIKNISASYGDSQSVSDTEEDRPGSPSALALRNLNLLIQPGEKVAICGRSGSGKSSTILLLLRLLDPINTPTSLPSSSASSMSIDGISLSTIDRTTLRRRIIAVPQDAVFLPDGTSFRENLDPFKVSTDADCLAVLQAVELWPFVSDKGGLDAGMISDSLSQGQKQLFSLARAMLRARIRSAALLASGEGYEKGNKGGVLLLDEVSSSVDVDTDRAMQRIIMREFEGYTIVMVSHRLDMVMGFNKVVVMDAGSVVEAGPPRELVETEGSRFRELWLVGNHAH